MDPLENLQKALFKQFEMNMQYLKMVHPNLHKKVEQLNYAINNNIVKPNYELELKENKYFDIYDTVNDCFLYNKDSNDFAKKQSNNISYDYSGINTLYKLFYDTQDKELAKKALPESAYLIIPDIVELNGVFKELKKENVEFDSINKFIFIGTLLGTHISQIHKKIQANDYLIYEPNLEIFRLSLFVCDYFTVAMKSNIVFCVCEDKKEVIDLQIKKFYKFDVDLNYNIKFNVVNNAYKPFLRQLVNTVYNNLGISFSHKLQLRDFKQSIQSIKNGCSFFNIQPLSEQISSKPVLIVGPGPSLNIDMDWLKEHKDKFIIVSLGASLKKLISNGIKPNIITSADGDGTFVKQFEIEDKSILKDIILIATSQTHQNITSLFSKEKVFIFRSYINILKNPNIAAASVGETTYALMLIFGFKSIYLLGLDLALDPKTGSSHDDSYKQQSFDLETFDNDIFMKSSTIDTNTLIEIPGNFKEKTVSTRAFIRLLEHYKTNNLSHKKDDQNVFNLSRLGALIEHTEPLRSENISLNEKLVYEQLNIQIIEELNKCIVKTDPDELKKEFALEIKKLEELKKQIKLFEELNVNSKDILKNILLKTMEEVSKTKFIYPYMEDTFFTFKNTINVFINFYLYQKIAISNEQLNNINKIYIKQLSSLIEDFQEVLKY